MWTLTLSKVRFIPLASCSSRTFSRVQLPKPADPTKPRLGRDLYMPSPRYRCPGFYTSSTKQEGPLRFALLSIVCGNQNT